MRHVGPYLVEEEFDKPEITKDKAKSIGDKLGVDWTKVKIEQLRKGISVEMEHGSKFNKITPVDTDLIHGDETKAAKIALAHLEEFDDYYDRLEKIE